MRNKCVQAFVFVGDEKIGGVKIWYDSGRPHRPGHTHMFCPCCGKVWGKYIVKALYTSRHRVVMSPCGEHGGGVFFNEMHTFDWFKIEYDREVLERDFCVMFNWVEGLVKPYEEALDVEGWPIQTGVTKHPMRMLLEDKSKRAGA